MFKKFALGMIQGTKSTRLVLYIVFRNHLLNLAKTHFKANEIDLIKIK